VSSEVADRDRAAELMGAEGPARAAKRQSKRVRSHKKRGKYRRYFGPDWAIHACRGHGFVRTTSWVSDLSELWTPLDADFAVAVKSLENRRIRSRVEAHPSPRVEVVRGAQIEVLGGN